MWQPPPSDFYKSNFDAASFTNPSALGIRVIIRDDNGEVMAALSAGGCPALDSDENETTGCCKAILFVMDVVFREVVIEGDNVVVMRSLSSLERHSSRLGNIIQDIQLSLKEFRCSIFRHIRHEANTMAHSLAHYARHKVDVLVWLEDSPPPTKEALHSAFAHLH